jgi:hypothetical protein
MARATGPDAAAVAVAVATALVPDPARRPSAAELAANLAHSARPAPVQMISPPRLVADEHAGDARETTTILYGTHGRLAADGADLGEPDLAAGGDLAGDDLGGDDEDGRELAGAGSADEGLADYGRAEGAARDQVDPSVLDGDAPDPRFSGGGDYPAALIPALLPDGPPTDGERDRRPIRRDQPARSRRGGGADESTSPRPSRGGPAQRPWRRQQAGGRGGAAPGDSRQSGRDPGRGPRGWVLALMAGVGAVAVVIAVVLLNSSGSSGQRGVGAPAAAAAATDASAAPSVGARPMSASPSSQDAWRAVLTVLNTARSRAFEQDDESALAQVYEVGGALYAQDLQSLRVVEGRGAHTSPLTTHILDLSIRQQSADLVVLRVTDQLDGYDFLDASGTVLAHKDTDGSTRADVTLIRTAGGWRISAREQAA